MKPTVDEIYFQDLEQAQSDDLMVRQRKITQYGLLYTCYGKHVEQYIFDSLGLRTTDAFTYANTVNERLFKRLFGSRFTFAFNSRIKIEKALMIAKLKELLQQGYDLQSFISDYEKNPNQFLTHEIDVSMFAKGMGIPSYLIETKIFTCPGQGSSILQKYLQPMFLKKNFVSRDYLALITFSSLVKTSNPDMLYEFPPEVSKERRTHWFLHLLILDHRILSEKKPTLQLADDLLNEVN